MLRKGLAAGAQPASRLQAALADLDAGLHPATARSGGGGGAGNGGGATTHSGLSAATAFLPTLAAGAPVQRRLPLLTPTAELGAERAVSAPVRSDTA